jgi:hypothetical protein
VEDVFLIEQGYCLLLMGHYLNWGPGFDASIATFVWSTERHPKIPEGILCTSRHRTLIVRLICGFTVKNKFHLETLA